MIGDSYTKRTEQFQIIESNQKFVNANYQTIYHIKQCLIELISFISFFLFKEDLLVTNNLFVDYFNAFLLNPVRNSFKMNC